MSSSLAMVFFLLVVSFSAILSIFYFMRERVKFSLIAVATIVISLLGGLLVILTLEQNVDGLLGVFLIMAGVAPAAMIVSVILHNSISGLLTYLLKKEFEEAVFFLMAIFGCPAAFLVGVIGSIVLAIRDML
jgi:hypothetical protein